MKKWKARWIWTHKTDREPFHICLFRHNFKISKQVTAQMMCAADSKYRLWVNGEYIGFGPARGNPKHPYYDTHSVRLKRGNNIFAFRVAYYSGYSDLFASVAGGLICQLEADEQILFASDSSWWVFSSKAYSDLNGRLFPEAYDARKEPQNWNMPRFDDSKWEKAKICSEGALVSPDELIARPIPMIPEKLVNPVKVMDAGECQDKDLRAKSFLMKDVGPSLWRSEMKSGQHLFNPKLYPQHDWINKPLKIRLNPGKSAYVAMDFGKETLASLETAVKGPAGFIVDFGYSECLDNNRVATQWQGHSVCDRLILGEGHTRHHFLQPRGFRYLLLRVSNPGRKAGTVSIDSLKAWESIYPVSPRGAFESADSLLNNIYSMSARTVNLCMEDAFTDCPWRERNQWLGDLQPEALFNYFAFGDYKLARKAILEFAQSNTDEGWLPGVFPSEKPYNLPTWGMRYPVIVWEYYLYSGDAGILASAYAAIQKHMSWLNSHENRDGFLTKLPGWNFVDWTVLDAGKNEAVVQGWYLEALEASSKVAAVVHDRNSNYSRRADRLRRSMSEAYWSKDRNAFIKYRKGSPIRPVQAAQDLIGQHENFLFCLLKIGSVSQRRKAIRSLAGATNRYLPNLGGYQSYYFSGLGVHEEQRGNFSSENTIRIGSPFWSFYALMAMLGEGLTREALDYIRLCWGLMIENGATSCWEMWDRHSSFCHGWSAAPAMILPAYFLGITPIEAGFRRFSLKPRTADLAWARGSVPTPYGDIRTEWERNEDRKEIQIKVSVPDKTTAEFGPQYLVPACGTATIRIDGKTTVLNTSHILESGQHRISIR